MISIVIPTYLNFEGVKACISSLEKYTDLDDLEILISANGAPKELKNYPFNEKCRVIWNDKPLGYAKACNAGIKEAKGEYIVLLNDDVVFLPQEKNTWLEMLLRPFREDSKVGLSGPAVTYSEPANEFFIIFFVVMIKKEVFDAIGLLSEDYGMGAGEDTEFCIEAQKAGFLMTSTEPGPMGQNEKYLIGSFPIWHQAEVTVHQLPNWSEIFANNTQKLRDKYGKNNK
jgi:O-antigen biosynthesis protein